MVLSKLRSVKFVVYQAIFVQQLIISDPDEAEVSDGKSNLCALTLINSNART